MRKPRRIKPEKVARFRVRLVEIKGRLAGLRDELRQLEAECSELADTGDAAVSSLELAVEQLSELV